MNECMKIFQNTEFIRYLNSNQTCAIGKSVAGICSGDSGRDSINHCLLQIMHLILLLKTFSFSYFLLGGALVDLTEPTNKTVVGIVSWGNLVTNEEHSIAFLANIYNVNILVTVCQRLSRCLHNRL